jgi:hypothetical protein
MGGERQMPGGVPGVEPFSVVEVGGQRLVEPEVGHGLGVGGVKARRLVEHEVALRRAASRCEAGFVGKVEVNEDGGKDGLLGDEGEDLHGPTAGGTEERQDLIDPGEEYDPAYTRRAGWGTKATRRSRSWRGERTISVRPSVVVLGNR